LEEEFRCSADSDFKLKEMLAREDRDLLFPPYPAATFERRTAPMAALFSRPSAHVKSIFLLSAFFYLSFVSFVFFFFFFFLVEKIEGVPPPCGLFYPGSSALLLAGSNLRK